MVKVKNLLYKLPGNGRTRLFYRLSMSNAFADRVSIDWGKAFHPSGLEHVSYALKLDELQERLFLNQQVNNCKAYKTTLLPQWARSDYIVLDIKEGECPDIIPEYGAVVSEKVRQIIEKFDDFYHQFLPVKLVDETGCLIVQQTYYHMVVRRQVVVEGQIFDLGKIRKGYHAYGNHCPKELINKLAYIEHQPEIRAFLETLPLWRLQSSRLGFFVNQELYSLLKDANVTGIESFGDKNVSEPTAAAI